MVVVEWCSFEVQALFAGMLGTLPLAAHTILVRHGWRSNSQTSTAQLCYMAPLGVSTAATIRIGQALGAGDAAAARLAFLVSLMLN